MTENNTQAAECLSHLTAELGTISDEFLCVFTGKPINEVLTDIGREVARDIFVCESVGHVTGGVEVTEQADGTWLASCPIGNLFGEEVDGEHTGVGETREAAILELENEIKNFDEFMWM